MASLMEFRFSKKKLILVLLAGILMTGASYFCTTLPDKIAHIAGWSGVVFFGLCILIIPTKLFNTEPQVIINDMGIEQRNNRLGVIAWADIKSIRVASIDSNNKFLCLDVIDPEKYLFNISELSRKIIAFNKSMGFTPISIGFAGLTPSIDEAANFIHSRYGIKVE